MKKKGVVLVVAAVGLIVFLNGSWPKARAQFPRPDTALSNATRAILENSETFVLLSLDPSFDPVRPPEEQKKDKRELFHKRRVLGKTEIKDPKRKSELLKALYKGVEQYETGEWASPECFIPRHGIKATVGTNWVELVICFECKQIREDSNKGQTSTMVSDEPRQLFNRTLQEAGVPLAKR